MKYVFGPVHSRRLGLSLGIDPVQDKTCTLDCVYCQLGATCKKTFKRGIFAPADAVLNEVRTAISTGKKIDYITFSGTGEPTLNSELGHMIAGIKAISRVPVAVITNSTLLHLEEVRRDLMLADLVVPSVDAVDRQTFEAVNRPHPDIDLNAMLTGLQTFSREYTGRLWVEVMLVKGINDGTETLQALAEYVKQLTCEKIQINTVTRPPAERSCRSVDTAVLELACSLFGPRAEIISSSAEVKSAEVDDDPARRIHALLRSHPCTMDQMCTTLGLTPGQADEVLQELLSRKIIEKTGHGSQTYYRASGR